MYTGGSPVLQPSLIKVAKCIPLSSIITAERGSVREFIIKLIVFQSRENVPLMILLWMQVHEEAERKMKLKMHDCEFKS